MSTASSHFDSILSKIKLNVSGEGSNNNSGNAGFSSSNILQVLDDQIYLDDKFMKYDLLKYEEPEEIAPIISSSRNYFCYLKNNQNSQILYSSTKNYTVEGIFNLHSDKVIYITTCKGDIDQFASVSQDGTLYVWRLYTEPKTNNVSHQVVLKHSIDQKLVSTFKNITWKDIHRFAIIFNKEIKYIELTQSNSNNSNSNNNNNEQVEGGSLDEPDPKFFRVISTDNNIIDASFSPRYDIIYVLLEGNIIQSINTEDKIIREFKPDFGDNNNTKAIYIQTFKNINPQEKFRNLQDITRDLQKQGQEYDFSLKDIILVFSSAGHIIVYDISKWNEDTNSYHIISREIIPSRQTIINDQIIIPFTISFDETKNFLIVLVNGAQNDKQRLIIYHCIPDFYVYNDRFIAASNNGKFFDGCTELLLRERILAFDTVNVSAKDLNQGSSVLSQPIINCNSNTIINLLAISDKAMYKYNLGVQEIYPQIIANEFDEKDYEDTHIINKQQQIDEDELKPSFPPGHGPKITEIIEKCRQIQPINIISSNTNVNDILKISEDKTLNSEDNHNINNEDNDNTIKTKLLIPSASSSKESPVKSKEDIEVTNDTKILSLDVLKDEGQLGTKKKSRNKRGGGGGKSNTNQQEQNNNNNNDNSNNESRERKYSYQQKNVEADQVNLNKGNQSQQDIQDRSQKRVNESVVQLSEESLQYIVSQLKESQQASLQQLEQKVTQSLNSQFTNYMNKEQEVLSRKMEQMIQNQFSKQFQSSVTPCVEKYLKSTFDQVNKTYEKGHKYYLEKIEQEKQKNNNLKQTFSDILQIYLDISKNISESVVTNKKNYNNLQALYLDKGSQLDKLQEQLTDILNEESEVLEKLSTLEKRVSDFCVKLDKEEDKLYDKIKKLDDIVTKKEKHEENKNDREYAQQQQPVDNTPKGFDPNEQKKLYEEFLRDTYNNAHSKNLPRDTYQNTSNIPFQQWPQYPNQFPQQFNNYKPLFQRTNPPQQQLQQQYRPPIQHEGKFPALFQGFPQQQQQQQVNSQQQQDNDDYYSMTRRTDETEQYQGLGYNFPNPFIQPPPTQTKLTKENSESGTTSAGFYGTALLNQRVGNTSSNTGGASGNLDFDNMSKQQIEEFLRVIKFKGQNQ